MTAPRTIPPMEADERATLTAFLDRQRATLAVKCEGLTDGQLRERAVPPSSLSLLGIVRHMAEVEKNWFRPVLGGEPMATIFAGVLTHMIEEYARHNGHADLLRERLDSSTGELYPERAWYPAPAHLTAALGRDPGRPARRPPAAPLR